MQIIQLCRPAWCSDDGVRVVLYVVIAVKTLWVSCLHQQGFKASVSGISERDLFTPLLEDRLLGSNKVPSTGDQAGNQGIEWRYYPVDLGDAQPLQNCGCDLRRNTLEASVHRCIGIGRDIDGSCADETRRTRFVECRLGVCGCSNTPTAQHEQSASQDRSHPCFHVCLPLGGSRSARFRMQRLREPDLVQRSELRL